jgi:hypothetical protein
MNSLLTILLLLHQRVVIFGVGISILAVVDGISSHEWTAQSITDAALGLGIAFSSMVDIL